MTAHAVVRLAGESVLLTGRQIDALSIIGSYTPTGDELADRLAAGVPGAAQTARVLVRKGLIFAEPDGTYTLTDRGRRALKATTE